MRRICLPVNPNLLKIVSLDEEIDDDDDDNGGKDAKKRQKSRHRHHHKSTASSPPIRRRKRRERATLSTDGTTIVAASINDGSDDRRRRFDSDGNNNHTIVTDNENNDDDSCYDGTENELLFDDNHTLGHGVGKSADHSENDRSDDNHVWTTIDRRDGGNDNDNDDISDEKSAARSRHAHKRGSKRRYRRRYKVSSTMSHAYSCNNDDVIKQKMKLRRQLDSITNCGNMEKSQCHRQQQHHQQQHNSSMASSSSSSFSLPMSKKRRQDSEISSTVDEKSNQRHLDDELSASSYIRNACLNVRKYDDLRKLEQAEAILLTLACPETKRLGTENNDVLTINDLSWQQALRISDTYKWDLKIGSVIQMYVSKTDTFHDILMQNRIRKSQLHIQRISRSSDVARSNEDDDNEHEEVASPTTTTEENNCGGNGDRTRKHYLRTGPMFRTRPTVNISYVRIFKKMDQEGSTTMDNNFVCDSSYRFYNGGSGGNIVRTPNIYTNLMAKNLMKK